MSDARKFTFEPGKKTAVPLLIGISGPSSSGKTFSALRLASGIQQVKPGPIVLIDTENRRGLHYAKDFEFQYLDFQPPFGSLDYVEAVRQADALNPAAIVIDSMSHEHDGPGGLLECHERELDRMAGSDYAKRERVKLAAWNKPKSARRVLINGLTRTGANVILCFRADEKVKPGKDKRGKTEIIEQGFTPIADPKFVYEMAVGALLRPGSQGVPVWSSDMPGERTAIKRPGWAESILKDGEQLCEAHGKALAIWAQGDEPAPQRMGGIDIDALTVEGAAAAGRGTDALKRFWGDRTNKERALLQEMKDKPGGWKDTAAETDRELLEQLDEEVPF